MTLLKLLEQGGNERTLINVQTSLQQYVMLREFEEKS